MVIVYKAPVSLTRVFKCWVGETHCQLGKAQRSRQGRIIESLGDGGKRYHRLLGQ